MSTQFKTCIILALLAPLSSCGRTSEPPASAAHSNEAGTGADAPNIVIIFTDDLGYDDVGCYWTPNDAPGYERIETPNIDRMADEGMRFTSFCVADSVCSPSRAALLTGCYPARNGMSFAPEEHGVVRAKSNEGLNLAEITLAELLQARGYATACVGKWHLGNRMDFLPTRQGFDEYYGPASRGKNQPAQMLRGESFAEAVEHEQITARYTREAIRFIEENRARPFFLYLSHGMPHVPLAASAAFAGKSPRGLYGDAVMELDWSTGEILQALTRLNLDDNTLVIFTSDNGPAIGLGDEGGKAYPLRSGKSSAFEGGFRVPCVMRWPGKIPAGSVCTELATTMDFLPTLCRLAEVEPPRDRVLDGQDIWDLMSAAEGAASPYEAFAYYRKSQLQAIRSGPWKLHFDASGAPTALYNLTTDVSESTDVGASEGAVVQSLAALAQPMRRAMGDASKGMQGEETRPVGRSDSASVKSLSKQ